MNNYTRRLILVSISMASWPVASHAITQTNYFSVFNLGDGHVEARIVVTSPASESDVYDEIEAYVQITHDSVTDDSDSSSQERYAPWAEMYVEAEAEQPTPVAWCEYCGSGSFIAYLDGVNELDSSFGPLCDEYTPGIK